MKIQQAQNTVAELLKIFTPELQILSHIGELANEIMQKEIYEETSDNEKITSELTDVFVSLLELAN